MLAVFYYNEKIVNRLYYEVYPSLPPFCNLTPIQLFFDLVGHEGKLLEEYSNSQTPVILEALSFLSHDEILQVVKNLSKYGLFDNRCTICGNSKTEMKNKNEQARHCCLWQPNRWRRNWEFKEEDWQAFLTKILKNGRFPSLNNEISPLHRLLVPVLIQTQTNSDCNAHTIFSFFFASLYFPDVCFFLFVFRAQETRGVACTTWARCSTTPAAPTPPSATTRAGVSWW
jgi:hypothetical protein